LVGIERSGRKAIILKRKKNFRVHKENSDPKKQFFDFCQKNFQVPGAWLMPPGIQSPRPDHP
jgi:hypothetical protein